MQIPIHRSLAPALVLVAALPAAARAQGAPRFLVSPSSDVAAGGASPAIAEGDVALVGGGATPRVVLAAGHFLATAGFTPGDVDALGRRPGAAPGSAAALAFSILANEGGVLDGDVLGLAPDGGVEVVVPESALLAALGVPAENVDVDALAWDAAGRLCFSLQNDLEGTVLGPVLDGDVLRLEPSGGVTRVLTEADVEAKLAAATGAVEAVNDVQGLDFVGGEAYVAVQSPSAYDGAVLGTGTPATIVADEAALGLGGAEIDALLAALPEDELPVVRAEVVEAPAGQRVQVTFEGPPHSVQLVVASGKAACGTIPWIPGFSALYVDPLDPWFTSMWSLPAPTIAVMGPGGTKSVDFGFPAAFAGPGFGGEAGWSFQTLDLGTFQLGAPFRVAML